MKSLMMFFDVMLSEFGSICNAETSHDLKTVMRRVESEGDSFLTITLGDFLSDFEKSLAEGSIAPTSFQSFGWKGKAPRFLSGFLEQIFDTASGILLDDPDIEAIRAVRQLTGFAKKVERPTTKSREASAFNGYIKCDAEIGQWEDEMSPTLDWRRFDAISTMLYGQFFSDLERKLDDGELLPKHGPGATADRLRGNAKWSQRTWTDRLEPYFPSGEWLIPNWSFLPDIKDLQFLDPAHELPVRVIGVPKTLKTLRIIAIEPTCMQYAQQALLGGIVDLLKTKDHSLLRKLIGWKDQTANHRMAYLGSLDGSLATLDLSEASDRVSMLVVRRMMRNHKSLLGAVESCRSLRAGLSDGRDIPELRKFASMGSALTFPMEAMVFMIMTLIGIEAHRGQELKRRDLESLSLTTRVYGDDIIVPSDSALSVMTALETFGLKVNRNKSFWTGKFRESCGKDFYDGSDVSYVKVRHDFPRDTRDAQEIVSTVSLRNQLYKAGMWQTVRHLDNFLEGLIPFPAVAETSPALGKHSALGYETQRWDRDLHRPLVKAARVHAPIPVNPLDGYAALMKSLLGAKYTPDTDPQDWNPRFAGAKALDHLLRSGRPSAVSIKLRWLAPF